MHLVAQTPARSRGTERHFDLTPASRGSSPLIPTRKIAYIGIKVSKGARNSEEYALENRANADL
jgi:hypothetical protein